MALYGGINFDEEDGSPRFKIANWRVEVTQTGYTAWSDVNAFYQYLMAPTVAYGELIGIFAGAGFPANTRFRIYDVDVQPFGGITGADATGVNTYAQAYWTLKYQTPSAPINQADTQDPVPFLTHEWDVGGEFVVPNKLGLQWGDGTSAGGEARGGLFIPTTEMNVNWPRLVAPPFAAIRALRGKVNNATILFDTGSATAETLLFLGAKIRRDFLTDGSLAWTFSYKFSEKSVPAADGGVNGNNIGGWNHFFRSTGDKCGFYRLQLSVVGPDGTKDIYEKGDFSALFL